jgi:nitric oxide reductase subunit C
MTKNSARNWFFIGTFACMVLFLALTIHTMSTIPKYTNTEKLTDEVVAGKKVWEKYNCIGCHTLIGEGSYYAPELKDIYSQKGPAFIKAFLKDPVKIWYGSVEAAKGQRKMPNFNLSEQEINSLVAFFEWVDKIDTHNWPPRPGQATAQAAETKPASPATAAQTVPGAAQTAKVDEKTVKGEAIIKEKACTSCHKIKGVGTSVGPDLTGVAQRLDDEALTMRLRDPKSVNPDSIMPAFGFTDEELAAIIAYLKTL